MAIAAAMTCCSATAATAGSDDFRPVTPADTLGLQAFAGNPAMMGFLLPDSHSDMNALGRYAHTPRAIVVEEGRGHLTANVVARSFLRLNALTTVWGDARFTTGSRRDIQRNNSADYAVVGPYVLADSVGGDLSTRQYEFSGGYCGMSRNSARTWGAQIRYTASIDYRNRDPRDKNIVSDLKVDLGAALRLAGRYRLGLGAGLRVYNQESDIAFYNPNNDIRTYAMTGLGTWYPRFSGNSASSVAYTGLGFDGAVNLMPGGGTRRGVSSSFTFSYLNIDQLLRDYNNLHLTTAQTYRGVFYLGWQHPYRLGTDRQWDAGATLTVEARRRIGFENIFGTAVGNNFVGIGHFRGFYSDRVAATFSLPQQISTGRWTFTASPAVCGEYHHDDYPNPRRALESHAITTSLRLGAICPISGKVEMGVEINGAYRMATADRCKLTGLDTATSNGRAVLHNFYASTANRPSVEGSLWVDWTLQSRLALRLTLTGASARYRTDPGSLLPDFNTDTAGISLGARF